MEGPTLDTLMAVAPQLDGSFAGRCLTGARGRIFGGQVAAQALHAATLVAPNDRDPHSFHSSFLRPGDPDKLVKYVVATLKDGRSLTTLRVDAYQDDRLIFTSLASFHRGEPSAQYQVQAPNAMHATLCPENYYVPKGSNPQVRLPIEFRYPDPASTSDVAAPPKQITWMRARTALPDDFWVHACALTYMSDLTLSRTAHMPLRGPTTTQLGASLDHSLWFHRRFRADEWQLFSQETINYSSARALSNGQLFTADGLLVASVSQEALIRAHPNN